MHTRTHGHPSIRYRHSDFQILVAAEVTRLKPPGDQSLLTSAATVFDAAPPSAAAFTRAELLISLAVFSLLVAIVLPALAHDRARSARIICVNNLRQIGAAMQAWGNDHQDLQPWEVPPVEGGTKAHPLAVNVWLHFAVLSNELASARILFCPTDTGTPAFDFGSSPEGGYLSPNYRNAATSYLVAHRDSTEPMVMTVADRNLLGAAPRSCVVFGMALSIRVPSSGQPTARWGGGLHNGVGNALRANGQVDQITDRELLDVSYYPGSDNFPFDFVAR